MSAAQPLVLSMMTTLDGRLDDPMAWVTGVAEDQYADILEGYEAFGAILVGRTTFGEMAAYWPTALEGGTAVNRRMAERMRDLPKHVATRTGAPLPAWENAGALVAPDDAALAEAVADLKGRAAGPIHLAGGASLARACLEAGLVDEVRLHVYPATSAGRRWFNGAPRGFALLAARAFSNGVVGLRYAPAAAAHPPRPAQTFTELVA